MKPKTVDMAALGSKGGTARAKKLTKKRRKEIAKLAARTRWDKTRKENTK